MTGGADLIVGLIFFALFLAVLVAIGRIDSNVKKIREHLDAQRAAAPAPPPPVLSTQESPDHEASRSAVPRTRQSVPATPRAPWEPPPAKGRIIS